MAVTLSVLLHKDSSEEAAKHRRGKHRKEGDQTDFHLLLRNPLHPELSNPSAPHSVLNLNHISHGTSYALYTVPKAK